jgi:hypothetical protein
LRRQLAKRDQWLEQLEERATTADARADEAQSELDTLGQQVGQVQQERDELAAQLDQERKRARAAARDARQAERAEKLEEQVRGLEAKLAHAENGQQDAAADLKRLEQQLVERGNEVRSLEAALGEAGRAGRELWWKLEDAEARAAEAAAAEAETTETPTPVEGRGDDEQDAASASLSNGADDEPLADVEAMAALQAQQSANLAAAEWTIAQLLAQIEAETGPDTAALLRQLHEAQTQLQRQAVLIHQRLTSRSAQQTNGTLKAQEPDR